MNFCRYEMAIADWYKPASQPLERGESSSKPYMATSHKKIRNTSWTSTTTYDSWSTCLCKVPTTLLCFLLFYVPPRKHIRNSGKPAIKSPIVNARIRRQSRRKSVCPRFRSFTAQPSSSSNNFPNDGSIFPTASKKINQEAQGENNLAGGRGVPYVPTPPDI